MKLFAFIFAFYVLGISIMPCNDVHTDAGNSITTFEQAQNHHEEHQDICSPFCICSCCQSFAALFSAADGAADLFRMASGFSNTNADFIASALAPIWQPPRLG